METRKPKLISSEEMKALLREADAKSLAESYDRESDPIANAMKRNPGLTRAEAEEMARAFGF